VLLYAIEIQLLALQIKCVVRYSGQNETVCDIKGEFLHSDYSTCHERFEIFFVGSRVA